MVFAIVTLWSLCWSNLVIVHSATDAVNSLGVLSWLRHAHRISFLRLGWNHIGVYVVQYNNFQITKCKDKSIATCIWSLITQKLRKLREIFIRILNDVRNGKVAILVLIYVHILLPKPSQMIYHSMGGLNVDITPIVLYFMLRYDRRRACWVKSNISYAFSGFISRVNEPLWIHRGWCPPVHRWPR